jgi:hypothetical protein
MMVYIYQSSAVSTWQVLFELLAQDNGDAFQALFMPFDAGCWFACQGHTLGEHLEGCYVDKEILLLTSSAVVVLSAACCQKCRPVSTQLVSSTTRLMPASMGCTGLTQPCLLPCMTVITSSRPHCASSLRRNS